MPLDRTGVPEQVHAHGLEAVTDSAAVPVGIERRRAHGEAGGQELDEQAQPIALMPSEGLRRPSQEEQTSVGALVPTVGACDGDGVRGVRARLVDGPSGWHGPLAPSRDLDFAERHGRRRHVQHEVRLPARGDGHADRIGPQQTLPAEKGDCGPQCVGERPANHTAVGRLLRPIARHAEVAGVADHGHAGTVLLRLLQGPLHRHLRHREPRGPVPLDHQGDRRLVHDLGLRLRDVLSIPHLGRVHADPSHPMRGMSPGVRLDQHLGRDLGGLLRVLQPHLEHPLHVTPQLAVTDRRPFHLRNLSLPPVRKNIFPPDTCQHKSKKSTTKAKHNYQVVSRALRGK